MIFETIQIERITIEYCKTERDQVSNKLLNEGWEIKVSGPKIHDCKIVPGEFKIIAEREVVK